MGRIESIGRIEVGSSDASKTNLGVQRENTILSLFIVTNNTIFNAQIITSNCRKRILAQHLLQILIFYLINCFTKKKKHKY